MSENPLTLRPKLRLDGVEHYLHITESVWYQDGTDGQDDQDLVASWLPHVLP